MSAMSPWTHPFDPSVGLSQWLDEQQAMYERAVTMPALIELH